MKLLSTFLFVLISEFSFSQTLPTNCLTYTSASYGSIDFTTEQYGEAQFVDPVTMSPLISYKKSNSPNLSDIRYPPKNGDETCNDDIVDSMTKCDLNTSVTDLNYVVYYPTSLTAGTTTKGCLFPAIILFHGGGFDDCKKPPIADASLGGIGAIAQEFAKHGYVAYVVEYRTGRYVAPYGAFLSAQQSLAEYRAFQDARGAIRSIIRHQRRTADFPNDPYQIDTTRLFLGGNSAGSIIAIHSAYYNAAQIAAIFPTPSGQPTIATALGPIDIDYYYGGLNTGVYNGVSNDYRPLIKGVFNMWGQMTVPYSYYNAATNTYRLQDFWTDYGNTIIPPMIAFHGFNDLTLPIVRTNITFAPDHSVTVLDNMGNPKLVNYIDYNSENNCLLNSPTAYKLDVDETTPDIIGAGSKGMYDMFHTSAFNQRIELYVDCQMAHGLDADVTCINCGKYNPGIVVKGKCQVCTPFQSNFGTTHYNSTDVQIYMVQRAATFFQAVLTNQVTNLGNDIFIECENFCVKSYDANTNPHNLPVTTNNPSSCAQASCSFTN